MIQLLEEKKIKKSDFIITKIYHTRLGEDVSKLFIGKINSNFNVKYSYKNGKNYSYQFGINSGILSRLSIESLIVDDNFGNLFHI